MNDLERVLHIKFLMWAYSEDYLKNEAPPEVLTEILGAIESTILHGVSWP